MHKKTIVFFILSMITYIYSMEKETNQNQKKYDLEIYKKILHLHKDYQEVIYKKVLRKMGFMLNNTFVKLHRPKTWNIGPGCIKSSENHTTLSLIKNSKKTGKPYRLPFYLQYFPYKEYIFYGEEKTRSFYTQYDKEQDSLFDGPNKNNILIIGINNKHRSQAEYSIKLADKVESLTCPSSYIIALALARKQNRIALCTDNRQSGTKHARIIELFDYSQNKKTRHPLATTQLPMSLKKIAFITNKTLLGVTKNGLLYTIVLHDNANKTISFHQQTVTNNNNEIMHIKTFAINTDYPHLILLLDDKKHVYFANLKNLKQKKTFIKIDDLNQYTNVPEIYFCGNKVGYLTKIKKLTETVQQNIITKELVHFKPHIPAINWMPKDVIEQIQDEKHLEYRFKSPALYYQCLSGIQHK